VTDEKGNSLRQNGKVKLEGLVALNAPQRRKIRALCLQTLSAIIGSTLHPSFYHFTIPVLGGLVYRSRRSLPRWILPLPLPSPLLLSLLSPAISMVQTRRQSRRTLGEEVSKHLHMGTFYLP